MTTITTNIGKVNECVGYIQKDKHGGSVQST